MVMKEKEYVKVEDSIAAKMINEEWFKNEAYIGFSSNIGEQQIISELTVGNTENSEIFIPKERYEEWLHKINSNLDGGFYSGHGSDPYDEPPLDFSNGEF